MVDLKTILNYEEMVIQCHDNPDADTLASGFALYTYLKQMGKDVRLIYGGIYEVTKPNLKIMIRELGIPIEYVRQLNKVKLLITVDAQPKGGNITHFEAEAYCAIDHHIQVGEELPLSDIRPYLGSCSTLIWDLLFGVNFDVNHYPDVATALYYGILTDTNSFAELSHPLDKDMLDMLEFDAAIIRKFKNSNLSLEDLETAAISLIRCSTNDKFKVAVLESRPCDPNILGFISDLAIQVDDIWTCIVYYDSPQGIKYSVRSCVKEVKANEFAQFIAGEVGSGGGHADKAGGSISKKAYADTHSAVNVETYFHNMIREYFESYNIIYAEQHKVDLSDMKIYKKKRVVVGYVPSVEIFGSGTSVRIRTLEGDMDFVTSQDTYIMVGIEGEAQPIQREKFERSYMPTEESFEISFQYDPIVKNKVTGEAVGLKGVIRACVTTSSVPIYAKPLDKNLKVFTAWDKTQYISGVKGDYMAVRQDDLHDIYVIRQDIFYKTYTEVV